MIGSRRFSVHQALGGGSVADVLMWKKYGTSVVILISSTTFWYLFECAGYNLWTFILNVLLFFVVTLFLWAKSASTLNRTLPPLPELEVSEESVVRTAELEVSKESLPEFDSSPLPPLPELEVSEESFVRAADVIRVWINQGLVIVKEIAVHRDFSRLVQVVFVLWLISVFGSFFNLVTLLYLGVLLCLFGPLSYDKYQDRIEDKLIEHLKTAELYYRTTDDILRKIQMSFNKKKKTQ